MTTSKLPAPDNTTRAVALTDSFKRDDLSKWSDSIEDTSSKHRKVGYIVFIVVFVIGGLWSSLAEIGGAVIASGRIVAEDRNRIIQHLEGGIIDEVLVKEGDRVKEGDVLARLSDMQVGPQYRAAMLDRAILRTQLARHRAEVMGLDAVALPQNYAEQVANEPALEEAKESQKAEFLAAKRVLDSRLTISVNQERAAKGRAEGQRELLQALEKQAELYKLELRDFRDLLEKGLIRRTQVFETERRVAEVDARIASTRLEIRRAEDEAISYQNQQEEYLADYMQSANTAIVELQKQLNVSDQQVAQLQDTYGRLEILAPTDAVVLRIGKRSKGMVVQRGDGLFELFPESDTLTLEVAINVTNIEQVHVGQDVNVIFPSNREQAMLPVPGKLTYISADATVDDRNPAGAYTGYVTIDPDQEFQDIVPGNLAEVYIQTEPRTLLEILARPITRFTYRAFKG